MKGGPVLGITPEKRQWPELWEAGGVLLPEIFQKILKTFWKKFFGKFRKSGIIFKSQSENFSDGAMIMFSYLFS
jgi:hypothetical protein